MANTKTAISLPESLFEQVDTIAREMNISRSHVFTLAAEAFIEQYQNQKLLDAINEAYKDGPEPAEQEFLRQLRPHYRRLLEAEW